MITITRYRKDRTIVTETATVASRDLLTWADSAVEQRDSDGALICREEWRADKGATGWATPTGEAGPWLPSPQRVCQSRRWPVTATL